MDPGFTPLCGQCAPVEQFKYNSCMPNYFKSQMVSQADAEPDLLVDAPGTFIRFIFLTDVF